jgi:citrate synthase
MAWTASGFTSKPSSPSSGIAARLAATTGALYALHGGALNQNSLSMLQKVRNSGCLNWKHHCLTTRALCHSVEESTPSLRIS